MLKRCFDITASLIGLILLSPVLAVIAALIKLDSPGPVLYKGVRIGRFGRSFKLLKFRTMVTNAEQIGGSSTAEDDPRITRAGRLLRKFKLDELPQLFNVLEGSMSIVGPRPQVQWAVDLYSSEERRILDLKPGITDYASLKFRDEAAILKGSPDPDKTYMEQIHPEKMRLALAYLKERSMWVDCKIIGLTLYRIVIW
jgi:lipopolysaccharide/colanic/teichoic acid biosynthesis glycosyltransferase